jgi:hypothetical protein
LFKLYTKASFNPYDDWFGLNEAYWQFIDRNGKEFYILDCGNFKKPMTSKFVDIFKKKKLS